MKAGIGWLMAVGFSLFGQEIVAPWSNGFEKGTGNDCFQRRPKFGTISAGVGVNDSKALVIDPTKAGAQKQMVQVYLKRVPVTPGVKYKFSFMGKSEGPDTFEKNPMMEYLFFDPARGSKGKPLPGWQLQFFNEKQKPVKRVGPVTAAIVHGDWTRYEEVFYPPVDSRELQIIFHNFMNMDNRLLIDDVKLEAVDEGALNINPDFRYGLYNHSGYRCSNTRIVELAKDQLAMDATAGSFSITETPVTPGREYQLTAHLKSVDKRVRIIPHFCDANGKIINRAKTWLELNPPNREETKSISFAAPPGAAYVSVTVRNGFVLALKIEEKNKQ